MLSILQLDDVTSANTLLEFMRQRFGCPARRMDEMKFKAQLKKFLEKNPEYTYRDLAKVVLWAKGKGKRPNTLTALFWWVGDAYKAGALHSGQTAAADQIRQAIYDALAVEDDPEWRATLVAAQTLTAQQQVLQEWHQARSPETETSVPAARKARKALDSEQLGFSI